MATTKAICTCVDIISLMKNLFCEQKDLLNEADVEQKFILRLLEDLEYKDANIRPKDSLSTLVIGGLRGLPQKNYKPDFAIKKGRKIRWIIEAKAPEEKLDDHVWQPRAYSVLLNGAQPDNPVRYFLLTNGRRTRLYAWDKNDPLIELSFEDFEVGNQKYEKLKKLISFGCIDGDDEPSPQNNDFVLKKEPISSVNSIFSWCHQHIYKKDNVSQSQAFTEFIKIIALKLLSDRQIKDEYPELLYEQNAAVPKDKVKFSVDWLDKHAQECSNPLSDIQFREFVKKMEKEIVVGERKRIFDKDEVINLKSETIHGVVDKLQHVFLLGIDADLNGRLFETFLNATMRGKDLGQFFTPRSLVKLGVRLADIKVNMALPDGSYHTDTLIDACCGTGGFLIDSFADMSSKVRSLTGMTKEQQDHLYEEIRKNSIVGIDIGNAPNLSRVARLNMYLHGDGGTRIFHTDALDKDPHPTDESDSEQVGEIRELRQLLTSKKYFDVALTNPPFAKVYERDLESEARLLDQYKIGRDENGNERASIKSSLLFFERYYDLLKLGGRLISVIDDGILSGDDYSWFRDYLRSNFIVKAVISLPGDAFQRSKARVKTSFIILEKKHDSNQIQPEVFMYGCKYVGNDDPSRQRTLPIDDIIRQKAEEEINFVAENYRLFLSGHGDSRYIVSPERIMDRLDVKYCWVQKNRKKNYWTDAGLGLKKMSDLMGPKKFLDDQIIITKDNDNTYNLAVVRYTGEIVSGDEICASETSYKRLYVVNTGDIVVSNIAASYGSVAVVPEELDGHVVSNEYTVLKAKEGYNPEILKCILRSSEIRSQILLASTGANRTRIKWENMEDILTSYPDEDVIAEVLEMIARREKLRKELKEIDGLAFETVQEKCSLIDDFSDEVLIAFKPPK